MGQEPLLGFPPATLTILFAEKHSLLLTHKTENSYPQLPSFSITSWPSRKLCFLPLSQAQFQILETNNLKGPLGARCSSLNYSTVTGR